MLAKVKEDKEREKVSKRHVELYQARSKILKEEMTGYVWLYLQKEGDPKERRGTRSGGIAPARPVRFLRQLRFRRPR